MPTALVTGASGFIAGHVIEELLRHGYTVRGSVRGPRPELARFDIELVEADLADPAAWPEAVRGCDYVLHMASPLPCGEPTEAELTEPAIVGTRNVLRACVEAGVRRVVLTSSSAAVINVERPDDHVFTGADWSDPARCSPYPKGKTLAERTAWEIAGDQLELVALNPAMVIGPLQTARASASHEAIRRLLRGTMPAIPKLGFTTVDVRDVATAHRLALEEPEAAGQRYLLANEFFWMRELAELLAQALPERKIPTRRLPYPALWLASRFDASLRPVLSDVGVRRKLSSDKARRQLGWQTRAAQQTILETASSLIAAGLA